MTTPTTGNTVLFEQRGAVALITLNRPDALNSFTRAMHTALWAALDRAEGNPEIRALVITGAGRGFCAGADAGLCSPSPPPGAERVGVRWGCRRCLDDRLEDAVQVPDHLVVPEAHDPVAVARERLGPPGVPLRVRCMLAAVEFNRQLAGRDGEVDDEAADRVLPPDPERQRCLAQRPPELPLHVGRVGAEPAGNSRPLAERHGPSPTSP